MRDHGLNGATVTGLRRVGLAQGTRNEAPHPKGFRSMERYMELKLARDAAAIRQSIQLSAMQVHLTSAGGEIRIEVTAPEDRKYGVESLNDWVALVNPGVRMGTSAVCGTVGPNKGYPRVGTLVIAQRRVTVTQYGDAV